MAGALISLTSVAGAEPLPTSVVGILALIVAGLLASIVLLVKTLAEARGANAAVNNVAGPTISSNVKHLVAEVDRLVKVQDEFSAKGWQALPSDLATAPQLTQTVRELQAGVAQVDEAHDSIMGKLDAMDDAIRSHILWEETQKYPQ